MRVGTDGRKIPQAAERGPIGSLEHAKKLGVDGLFFRTMLELSPTLDTGALADVRARADELGLYLESGLGKVNPFATPEAPELRALGNGDIVLGFRRMMEAAAAIGCRELWIGTANFKPAYYGRLAYDRFRTDVTWPEQLIATERFLKRLAPIARDLGIHMNLETHEEITSFEVVRLVEAVGPDVTGIVFDMVNPLHRAEHPLFTLRRILPYVRQTHVKDAYLAHGPGGLTVQMRPLGQGVVDFRQIIPALAAAHPRLNLSIEIPGPIGPVPKRTVIEIDEPAYLNGHPDLSAEELDAYLDMVRLYEQRLSREQADDWETFARRPYDYAAATGFITTGAAYLRALCAEFDLPLERR
jgi:sugar phosphate isomerase/epimerase